MTEVREVAGHAESTRPTWRFHRHLLEDMLLARRASERLWNLQRQGRIATIPPLTGQEAAIVGVVRALDLAHDWLAPYYRELSAWPRSATSSSSRSSCTGGAIPTAGASPTACSASRRRSPSARRYRTPRASPGA